VSEPTISTWASPQSAGTEPVGRFDDAEYERLIGHVEGHVDRSEPVVGLRQVSGDGEAHRYRSAFEIIRPVDRKRRRSVIVEVESRGSPFMQQGLNRLVIGFSGHRPTAAIRPTARRSAGAARPRSPG
jgi:hypothetical protein